MSSDESETDDKGDGFTVKRVRRVAKGWVHRDITALWRDVDRIGKVRYDARGNQGLVRNNKTDITNNTAKPVPKLPRNYYNNTWYMGLHRAERRALSRKKDPVPVPSLVCIIQP
jgi:hypothetical protein